MSITVFLGMDSSARCLAPATIIPLIARTFAASTSGLINTFASLALPITRPRAPQSRLSAEIPCAVWGLVARSMLQDIAWLCLASSGSSDWGVAIVASMACGCLLTKQPSCHRTTRTTAHQAASFTCLCSCNQQCQRHERSRPA